MATVYLCTDRRDGRVVAVKVIRPEVGSTVVIERFLREIAYASELDHPRIPKVLDSGVTDGMPYYVMTFIEGESLRVRLDREKQLPLSDAVHIACEVIAPATYAHERGIVHRDLKPDNILLTADGVYVLDFGIARAIVESGVDKLTSTGVGVGTPAYMSPEQALGERNLDPRSDVYSLGCVVYEMVAGIPPFVGPTAQSVISRRFAASAPPMSEVRDGIPALLESAVSRALARAPADRWPSMNAFGKALKASLTQGGRVVAAKRSGTWTRRRVMRAAGVLAIPAVVGAAFALSKLPNRGAGGQARLADFDPRHIAVLYFDDHSADHSLGYLTSGLTESLIQELSAVSAIRVISRNGVKPFRDRPVPMDSVAATLHVGSIVEGSVQQSQNRVRVIAQLVDARTNTHLESATIERTMGELFLLEDDLAHEVARMLRRRIGKEIRVGEGVAASTSPRARELVLRADKARDDAETTVSGEDSLASASGLSLLGAADSLLAAAEVVDGRWIEPVIARGWVALDVALRASGSLRAQAFRRAIEHADRAIKREPGNGAPFELRGTILYDEAAKLFLTDAEFGKTLTRAQSDLERAITLDSSLATAWGTLSRVRVARGDLVNAEKDALTALGLDAYLKDAPEILVSLYGATLMRNSLPASWRWCQQGARDYPRNPRFVECRLTLMAEDPSHPPNPRLAWSLVAEGDRLDPPAHARAVGRPYLPFFRRMQAAVVSARAGDSNRARAVVSQARAGVSNDPELSMNLNYEEAFLNLVLGDRERALRLLSSYLAARPTLGRLVAQHPRWAPLKSDTAFVAMIRRAAETTRTLVPHR